MLPIDVLLIPDWVPKGTSILVLRWGTSKGTCVRHLEFVVGVGVRGIIQFGVAASRARRLSSSATSATGITGAAACMTEPTITAGCKALARIAYNEHAALALLLPRGALLVSQPHLPESWFAVTRGAAESKTLAVRDDYANLGLRVCVR